MSVTRPLSALAVLAVLPVGYAGAIQKGLRVEDEYMPWLIGDYVLGCAMFVLLGQRIVARCRPERVRPVAVTGLLGSTVLTATADVQQTLFAARWLQGACGILLIWATAYAAGKERPSSGRVRQGVIPASWTLLGLLGGVALSPHLTWRWMFAASLGVVFAAVGMPRRRFGAGGSVGSAERRPMPPHRTGLPVLLLATGSLQCLAYGATDAVARGWADGNSLPLAGCAALLGAAAAYRLLADQGKIRSRVR